MLVDHRTYRIKPGMTQAHLEIYEKYGFAAQTRHLGPPHAYMYAESGDINTHDDPAYSGCRTLPINPWS